MIFNVISLIMLKSCFASPRDPPPSQPSTLTTLPPRPSSRGRAHALVGSIHPLTDALAWQHSTQPLQIRNIDHAGGYDEQEVKRRLQRLGGACRDGREGGREGGKDVMLWAGSGCGVQRHACPCHRLLDARAQLVSSACHRLQGDTAPLTHAAPPNAHTHATPPNARTHDPTNARSSRRAASRRGRQQGQCQEASLSALGPKG
jgi:hypothetical protein